MKCVTAETTVLDFGERSFVEWDLKDGFYERLSGTWHMTQLQLMFRTRRPAGLLFKAQNTHKTQHLHLEVSDLCTLHKWLNYSKIGGETLHFLPSLSFTFPPLPFPSLPPL